jgi:hypothetical protein
MRIVALIGGLVMQRPLPEASGRRLAPRRLALARYDLLIYLMRPTCTERGAHYGAAAARHLTGERLVLLGFWIPAPTTSRN